MTTKRALWFNVASASIQLARSHRLPEQIRPGSARVHSDLAGRRSVRVDHPAVRKCLGFM
ncbi:hypothetical protein DPMN_013395 [Dreissena polymorpha]|uniref:Uncharacterized protein n=1 Tax=Dreissena polymorpha TaxID=45954 RepID=A0A9D4N7B9_DREPO|nr:hypothetical protein DPMN_013395 [Dreissena polymorpha]